jgi:hypothetical protein
MVSAIYGPVELDAVLEYVRALAEIGVVCSHATMTRN